MERIADFKRACLKLIASGDLVLDKEKTPLDLVAVRIDDKANVRNNRRIVICSDCEFGDYTSKGIVCSKKRVTFEMPEDTPGFCEEKELDSFLYDFSKAVFK